MLRTEVGEGEILQKPPSRRVGEMVFLCITPTTTAVLGCPRPSEYFVQESVVVGIHPQIPHVTYDTCFTVQEENVCATREAAMQRIIELHREETGKSLDGVMCVKRVPVQ